MFLQTHKNPWPTPFATLDERRSTNPVTAHRGRQVNGVLTAGSKRRVNERRVTVQIILRVLLKDFWSQLLVEVSVDKASSWCHLLAGMSLHFLRPIGIVSSTEHTGFAGTSSCCAWVSSMRDWFISAAEDSVPFASALSRSNSLLVGLGPGSKWSNLLRSGFVLTTHEVFLDDIVEGIWILIPYMPRHFIVWTSTLVQ